MDTTGKKLYMHYREFYYVASITSENNPNVNSTDPYHSRMYNVAVVKLRFSVKSTFLK